MLYLNMYQNEYFWTEVRHKKERKITFERKLIFERSSSRQKDIKMTLSQEEIIKLKDYLNLSNHQKNLLSSLNKRGKDNIIR